MKNCLILGRNSDIYKGIKDYLTREFDVFEYPDFCFSFEPKRWDVFIIFVGKVAPVGLWHEQDEYPVQVCFESNLLYPYTVLRRVWGNHNPGATVIWFSGSNPQGIMDGYATYNASKMAVNKLIEQLDHETPDCKFIAFGPGYVRDSKIHKATLEKNWPNPRIARGDAGTSMESIWNAMKWCIEQPKEIVGGRNVCVSDVPFDNPTESQFKLRRA